MTHDRAIATHATERYLLDEMPELERFQFEEHYFACAECAEAIRTGGLMRDGVAQGLVTEEGARGKEEGTTGKEEGARGKEEGARGKDGWGRLLPWAVAASLAVTTGYRRWSSSPGCATRSSAPGAGAHHAASGLSRRLADGRSPHHRRHLLRARRQRHRRRRAPDVICRPRTARRWPRVPRWRHPGAPLLLLVPATAFSSSGSYTLTVGPDAGGAGVAEYRFTLTDR